MEQQLLALIISLNSLKLQLAELQKTQVPVAVQVVKVKPKQAVEQIIRDHAVIYGVNPNMAVAVANCESQLNPKALGDNGQSRGLWQIHQPSHPEVTKEVAFDPVKSTKFAMPLLKKTPWLWSCWKKLYT